MARRDASEFAEFVQARSTALARTAYLMVGDHALAQDLLQEALTKTYAAWPRLRDVSKADAYTRKVITTTAISWKRRKSYHERPLEHLPERGSADRTDDVALHDFVWQHLLSLPPRQRAAVVLRFYEDLTEAQTAEAMGCAVGTVKSSVSQALSNLRAVIGPEVELFDANEKEVSA